MINFIFPKTVKGDIKSGVYKILFDNSYFYFGSTDDFARRFANWKYAMTKGNKCNVIMSEICKTVSVVEFVIIEKIVDKAVFIEREDWWIRQNINNQLSLNRAYTAYHTGCKLTKEQYDKFINSISFRKKVAKLSMDGIVLEVYDSIKDAVIATGIKNISWIMSVNGRTSGGYLFKLVDNDGNIVTAPEKWVRKLPKIERVWLRKPINQLDENGNIVATYSYYKEAAIAVGCSEQLIHRVLKDKTNKLRAKGFSWQYA